MQDPILKLNSITKKRAGGVVQIVDHLPHKHEALSSSPSLKKKKALGAGRVYVTASTSLQKLFLEPNLGKERGSKGL
jgi:hypothetical protein